PIDQVRDGSLGHVFITHQSHLARHQGSKSRQEAHSGARIADEEFTLRCLQSTATAFYFPGSVINIVDLNAHLGERRTHVASVVTVQHAAQDCGAFTKSGEGQGPIGDALRAGHPPHKGRGRGADFEWSESEGARRKTHGRPLARRSGDGHTWALFSGAGEAFVRLSPRTLASRHRLSSQAAVVAADASAALTCLYRQSVHEIVHGMPAVPFHPLKLNIFAREHQFDEGLPQVTI